MVWPSPALLWALLGLKRALLGLCAWLAMLGAGAGGLAMPVFTVYPHSAGCLHSATVYGLAYGLAYGIAWARLALSVWLRRGRAAILSIYRIMKPCLLVR